MCLFGEGRGVRVGKFFWWGEGKFFWWGEGRVRVSTCGEFGFKLISLITICTVLDIQ